MLSQLSKGYGSWTAGYVDPYFGAKKAHEHHELSFPEIDHESHIHGITVGTRSGRSTAMSWAHHKRSREPTLDGIPLPKTYTTRKGALQLYVGPDDLEDDDDDDDDGDEESGYALKPKYVEIKRPHGQELINLSLKLGTMERLAMSVLQFGDQDYDHEHTSVSDAKNKAFLKFLHKVDESYDTTGVDTNVQPGGDLNNYLRDLKSSASNHSGNMRISKSRESLELQAILRGLDNTGNWPLSYSQDGGSDRQSVGQFTRPVSRVSSRGASPGPPSTPRSSYQVLSAKKLCASIRSGSYLGRPSSRVNDDDDILESDTGPVTSATITRPVWTPAESMDGSLMDAMLEDNDSDGGKRRGLKERSFLTNNSQLYKGRIARKGEGQRAGEVKVTSKGDGDSLSQRMTQIEEELGESSIFKRNNSVVSDYDQGPDTSNWAVKVTGAKRLADCEQEQDEDIHESNTSSIIDVEIDEKEHLDKVHVKVNSRPTSHKSDCSSTGSTSTHTPSIITLQSINSPKKTHVSQDKFKGLYKRRNTYCYDPGKGLVRAHNNMRRKSENNVQMKQNGAGTNHTGNIRHETSPLANTSNRLHNGQAFLHPGWTAYNSNNGQWSVNSNNDSEWHEDSYAEDHSDARNKLKEMTEDVISKENFDIIQQADNEDNIETAVIDQEEYVLDNIAECNAEIKQIEELAAQEETDIYNDGYTDSESSMDEELIKVILTGQTEKLETTQYESETKDDLDIVEKCEIKHENELETEKIEEDVDDIKDVDKFDSTEQDSAIGENDEEIIEGSEVQDKPASRMSGTVNKEVLEVVGKGQPSPIEDDLDNVRQEVTDETVDEENASEVKSYRSGRKSRSKRSKSGTGSEEETKSLQTKSEDGVSTNEFSLPVLESDRLLGKEKDAHAIAAELDALGLRKKSKGEMTYPLLPPGKRPKAPSEKAKIPDHIAEALNRKTDASIEYLEQDLERMTALVGETLSGPTLEAVGEGLTEEELELAKQILQQKLDEAKGKLDGSQPAGKTKGKKPAGKAGKKGGKKGKGKTIEEEKTPEELDREAMREKHEQEKKMREQEAAELQKKIAEKQRMLKEQNDLSSARSKELQEEMERLEREAEAIQRAEDEAREILADVRKKQREERETRRKADLERKKQEAMDRREREKKEMEDKRRKEMEMMEKIADAEMRRRMKEEEERRIDEEERLAQEKYEAELREAQRQEEEEEERLKELERQAEEEAMQRLIDEREAAERERRRLRDEEEALRDAENLRRQAMEEEHYRLEEERRRMQEAENAKKEAERQRLLELRQLEHEARVKMQEEIEKRRSDALSRRDYNLENRLHVDKLKHNQGLTRAWTFSYFVQWPRETYESHGRRKLERRYRPIGEGDPRKIVKIKNPKPKQPVDPPPETTDTVAPAVP